LTKKNLWLGILAIVLIFTMTVAGCDFFKDLLNNIDDNGSDPNGSNSKDEVDGAKWETYGYQNGGYYTFNSPNFTYTAYPSPTDFTNVSGSGKYSISGSTITFTYSDGRVLTGTFSANRNSFKIFVRDSYGSDGYRTFIKQ